MSRQAELFPPERGLLFPNFETYRLHPLDPESDVAAYTLPGNGATQSRVGYTGQQLSFKEVRARISHNHLDTHGQRGVYIDVDWNVVGFELGPDLVPTFTTLATLPAPIDTHAEYPRALPLSGSVWAVSSGSGSLYILRVSPPGSPFEGKFTARYDVAGDGGTSPFLLYSATGSDLAKLLIVRPIVSPEEGSRFRPRKAVFELAEVQIDVNKVNGVDESPETLTPSWCLRGNDLPYWTTWVDGGWVILSEETFAPAQDEVAETEEERAKREHEERVAKLGLGASLGESETQPEIPAERADDAMEVEQKNYPFSWTQDPTSVSVTIPLPPGTLRSDIDVGLSRDSLSLAVKSDALAPSLSTFISKSHSFWTEIVLDESTWTYDPATAQLQIELQKPSDDGLRWPSVFVPDDDDDEDDVPETFAPSTLAAIRDSFSHATVRSDNGELPGNLPSMPALLREDMDLDFDNDEGPESAFDSAGTVGRAALIGFIADGVPTWSRQPASILSLPVTSGAGPATSPLSPTIIVKSAVDGLVFAPPAGNPSRDPWVHVGTNPALAFVMSSKRDLRLVRHVETASADENKPAGNEASRGTLAATVLGFESGSGTGNGNVYVYYPPAGSSTTARQGVVAVSGGERGTLLGVGCVRMNGGDRDNVVVALCERQLVVLRGVL